MHFVNCLYNKFNTWFLFLNKNIKLIAKIQMPTWQELTINLLLKLKPIKNFKVFYEDKKC